MSVPKEPEPVSKEPKLSSENSDQESADHSLLVGPSSITSNLTYLESQASGVTLPAGSLEEERAILQDFAANIDSCSVRGLPNGTIGYQWYHWLTIRAIGIQMVPLGETMVPLSLPLVPMVLPMVPLVEP